MSAGKPKKPHALKTICLMLGPDFITDIIEVGTYMSYLLSVFSLKGPFSSEILCAPGSFFIYEKYAIFFEVVESLLYLLQSS